VGRWRGSLAGLAWRVGGGVQGCRDGSRPGLRVALQCSSVIKRSIASETNVPVLYARGDSQGEYAS